MSGSEQAKAKESAAEIMRAKQAAGSSSLQHSLSLNSDLTCSYSRRQEGRWGQEVNSHFSCTLSTHDQGVIEAAGEQDSIIFGQSRHNPFAEHYSDGFVLFDEV